MKIYISAYEFIRRDPHKILERYDEQVPLTLAQYVGPSEMVDMVSDPANLYKTDKIPSNWPESMNNHVPYQSESNLIIKISLILLKTVW